MVKQNQTPAIACSPATALGWIVPRPLQDCPLLLHEGGSCPAEVHREMDCIENASVTRINPRVCRAVSAGSLICFNYSQSRGCCDTSY